MYTASLTPLIMGFFIATPFVAEKSLDHNHLFGNWNTERVPRIQDKNPLTHPSLKVHCRLSLKRVGVWGGLTAQTGGHLTRTVSNHCLIANALASNLRHLSMLVGRCRYTATNNPFETVNRAGDRQGQLTGEER